MEPRAYAAPITYDEMARTVERGESQPLNTGCDGVASVYMADGRTTGRRRGEA